MDMGVEVSRSQREFVADGVAYPRGTHVVFAGQHCRPYVVSLLRRTFYHLGAFSKYSDGTPVVPYDLSTYTVAEFMGVRVAEVERPFEGSFEALTSVRYPRGGAAREAPGGWLIDGRANEAFMVATRLLRKGAEVRRLEERTETGAGAFEAGSFHVPRAEDLAGELDKLVKRHHLRAEAAPQTLNSKPVKMLRLGVYQRYWGGNADEGWTRWLLEQYRFRYRTLMDKDIQRGKLASKYDVIIVPSDPSELITGEKVEEYYEKRWAGGSTLPVYPPEYRSGIGEEGAKRLKEFVEEGGTLLCWGESCDFAIEKLGLPVQNVLKDVKGTVFTCPGSTLHVDVDHGHPLAWGVQGDLLIVFRSHPAFAVKPRVNNDEHRVVLSYPDERIMESGWLTGEELLSRKAAMVEARLGRGRVVLYGFQPQMRAQTDATFKLLFNALLG